MDSGPTGRKPLSSVEIYDSTTKTWTAGPELPYPLFGAVMVQYGLDEVYSGVSKKSKYFKNLTNSEKYSKSQGCQSSVLNVKTHYLFQLTDLFYPVFNKMGPAISDCN